ncbi:HNH endonuclease signature motif containing protein [Blastococcus sp. Marseille-P5729]|uniref:HNH endonuclease signature motif containing protein n=1 Tax=Blastococcus sp. Marseille-P5729 TaxID=2086582 RepID=UPI00131E58DE|nr:HNH endonuclease signature motif containing protein [Blastococcus sp. Marseille-P5729]
MSSGAETPDGACGAAADPTPTADAASPAEPDWAIAAAASPGDAERLWLASDSARELDRDLDEAFDLLQRGYELLLGIGEEGELGALGPERLIGMAQRLEAHRTRLIMVDSYVIEAATEDRLQDHVCASSIPLALCQVLHISSGEANARAKRAQQLVPQNGFSSGATPPRLPLLADAVRDGAGVSSGQVDVICKAMSRVVQNPDLTHEKRELAEHLLVHQAARLTHKELEVAAEKVEEVVNPDGTLPSDEVAAARRGVVIGPEGRDGTHKISGALTREGKALFDAAIGPFAAPRPADADGADDRSAAQRTHDGLQDACQRLLELAGAPASGGTAATVHITIDLDRLIEAIAQLQDDTAGKAAQQAVGRVAGGDRLTITEILRLAQDATLVPVWMSALHGIVAYGRDRRTASPAQTHALIARDGGCSFPGCQAPPDWCQRHHVIAWWSGGHTDLDNLTLVCGYHHREFERRGWAVDIINGIPVWTPPRWLDPDQAPQINARIKIPCHTEIDHLAEAVKHAREQRARSRGGGGGRDPGDPADPLGLLGGLLDTGEDIDELIQLIATHIPTEQRDAFYRDAANLITTHLGPAAARGPAAPASTR